MTTQQTQPTTDRAEAPATDDIPTIVLPKLPDGFKPSTAVNNENAVPPVKPPRVAFRSEEI